MSDGPQLQSTHLASYTSARYVFLAKEHPGIPEVIVFTEPTYIVAFYILST